MSNIYPIEPTGLTCLMDQLVSSYGSDCIYQKHDLEIDFNRAKEYQDAGYEFVWLLRDSGSELVPIRGGCEPVTLNYWVDRGRDAVLFHYNPKMGFLSTIKPEKAKELIMLPPTLSPNLTLQQLEDRVLEVLSFGCNQQFWGIFWAPENYQAIGDGDWHSWLTFFQSRNIQPMINFMHKAISTRSKLRKRNDMAA